MTSHQARQAGSGGADRDGFQHSGVSGSDRQAGSGGADRDGTIPPGTEVHVRGELPRVPPKPPMASPSVPLEELTQASALSMLDVALMQRTMSVPAKLLGDDYASVAGGQPDDGEKQFRFLGNDKVYPWGSRVPFLIPLESQNGVVKFQIPQSRVRHYLVDAALHVLTKSHQTLERAVVRLGPNFVLQSFDSRYACHIAYTLKKRKSFTDITSTDSAEGSQTIQCPFSFAGDSLRAIPLYFPNTPLPEIEYVLSGDVTAKVFLIGDFTSSMGETEVEPGSSTVQHASSIATFTKLFPERTVVLEIPVSSPEGKLVRCMYFQLVDEQSGDPSRREGDMSKDIVSMQIVGPPPQSMIFTGGVPIPGSLCRSHFKQQVVPPGLQLDGCVFPFACEPNGKTADYGIFLPEGSTVKLTIRPTSGQKRVNICLETMNRCVWRRA